MSIINGRAGRTRQTGKLRMDSHFVSAMNADDVAAAMAAEMDTEEDSTEWSVEGSDSWRIAGADVEQQLDAGSSG